MRKLRTAAAIAVSVILGASTAQAQSLLDRIEESYNFGPNPWRAEGLMDRISGAWVEVESCDELSFPAGEWETYYLFAASSADGGFVDVACEMEKNGNRVEAVAQVLEEEYPHLPRYFYRIRLADVATPVVLENQGMKSGYTNEEESVMAGFGYYRRLFNYETEERLTDKSYDDFANIGSAQAEIISFLLGNGDLDLGQIGL